MCDTGVLTCSSSSGAAANQTTLNAVELILQQNRTILPAKSKPANIQPSPGGGTSSSSAASTGAPAASASAILIPTSKGQAGMGSSSTTNFILTPVKPPSHAPTTATTQGYSRRHKHNNND